MPATDSKQGLMTHLPFIRTMLKLHKGTKLELKFNSIYETLTDKSRTLTDQQIAAINSVMEKYRDIERESREAQVQLQQRTTRRSLRIKKPEEEEEKEKDDVVVSKGTRKKRSQSSFSSDEKASIISPPPNIHKPFVDIKVEAESEDENLTEGQKRKKAEKEAKRLRELRKLEENIVKDAKPLPSRRSLKRVNFGEEYDTSTTSIVKKVKTLSHESEELYELPVEKKPPPIRRHSTYPKATIDEPSVKKARRDSVFPTVNTTRNTEQPKPTTVDEPKKVSPLKLILKKKKKKVQKSLTKKPTQDDSDDEWEDIEEEFLVSPPATVKKESPEEKVPAIKISLLKEKAAMVMQSSAQPLTPTPTPKSTPPPAESSNGETVPEYEFKIIENVAFARSRQAVIFKCMTNDCNFQCHHKHFYNQHATSRHRHVKWSGFCQCCDKMIFQGNTASLEHEIIHLHDHLLGSIIEKTTTKPVKSPTPPPQQQQVGTCDVQGNSKATFVIYPPLPMKPDSSMIALKSALDAKRRESTFRDKPIGLAESIDEVMKKIATRNYVPTPIRKISTSVVVPRRFFKDFSKQNRPATQNLSKTIMQPQVQINQAASLLPTRPDVSTTEHAKADSSPATPIPKSTSIKGIIGKKISLSSIPGLAKMIPQIITTKIDSTTKQHDKIKDEVKDIVTVTLLPNVTDSDQEQVEKKSESNEKSDSEKRENEIEKKVETNFDKVTPKNDEKIVENVESPQRRTTEDELLYHEALRPWLKKRTLKNFEQANKMKTINCLAARFKCMASTCSYFTTGQSIFKQHLSYHEKFTPKDSENFLQCSYCDFEAEFVEDLNDHIVDEHAFDRFHCGYCFYRSCHDFNVVAHQDQYHKMKPKKVVVSYSYDRRDLDIEVVEIEKKLHDFVPPITCVYCRAEKSKPGAPKIMPKFYIFRDFLLHLKDHKSAKNGKCSKCGGQSTKDNLYRHLINCHGFGLFQCVHCRFGTNTFEIMSNHLANDHPSKLAMFCERIAYTPESGPPPPKSSIKSIRLKTVTGYIEPSWKIRPDAPENSEMMKNQRTAGILGPNIVVKPKPIKSGNFNPNIQRIASGLTLEEMRMPFANQASSRELRVVQQKPTLSSPVNNSLINMSTFMPKTTKEKMIYETVVNQRSPQLAQLIRKKSSLDVPEKSVAKEGSGLMISDVYSLSDSKKK